MPVKVAGPEAVARERFEEETANHEMTVLRDDGLYRHLRFSVPGTYVYGFDIVTWPGYLAITGDIGERMFTRIDDMFRFFESTAGGINPPYWGEKVRPGGVRSVLEYSSSIYRSRVLEWLEQQTEELTEEDPEDRHPDDLKTAEELKAAVYDQLLSGEPPFDARDAMERLVAFEHDRFRISEPYEWDLTEFDSHYLWQCHAIVWGIRQYRAAAIAALDGRELDNDDPLRANLPEAQRGRAEMYAVTLHGELVGITDEYCTCHWAADGWTAERVTDLLLYEDGSPRE